MTACVDSDVLIDYFDGIPASAVELSRYETLLISRISWIEVLVGARTAEMSNLRESVLRQFKLVELDASIARAAISFRREHRLRLPDAIIWASARANHALLVTRNAKHFPRNHPGIRIPYAI